MGKSNGNNNMNNQNDSLFSNNKTKNKFSALFEDNDTDRSTDNENESVDKLYVPPIKKYNHDNKIIINDQSDDNTFFEIKKYNKKTIHTKNIKTISQKTYHRDN